MKKSTLKPVPIPYIQLFCTVTDKHNKIHNNHLVIDSLLSAWSIPMKVKLRTNIKQIQVGEKKCNQI